MTATYKHIETKLIHTGERPRIGGAVSMPIFQSAMFETFGGVDYHDIKYIRLNNTPNHIVLHNKLAALENGEKALVAGSGMAAISAAFFAVLSSGDHFLIQENVYGGTHAFVTRDLPALNIKCDFIDVSDPRSWEEKLRPNSRAVFVETISNPLMGVGDLKSVVAFAEAHELISLIDNTFASPVNFRPLEIGFDISLHSCTKYLNGHSDIVAGAAIGRAEWVDRIKHKLDHLGGTLDPHACFLLHRGMKTLALRVRHQNESALKIATFLEGHAAVRKVNYPGLKSNPSYAHARELLDGNGGMLSFELEGGLKEADTFMRSTTIPIIAPSLGGVETLLTRPAATSHASLSAEERNKSGVSDSLIRMSVGIESTDEIIEDIDRALGSLRR